MVIPHSDDNGGMIEIHVRYYQRHSLLRGGIFYFFVRAGKWGEVTSKCAKPGENRNESVRGTLGREKKRREELPSFRPSVVPCAPPIFHFSWVFFSPPSTEGASVEERGRHSREIVKLRPIMKARQTCVQTKARQMCVQTKARQMQSK